MFFASELCECLHCGKGMSVKNNDTFLVSFIESFFDSGESARRTIFAAATGVEGGTAGPPSSHRGARIRSRRQSDASFCTSHARRR